MASSRPAQRRAAPAQLTTQPKNILSVEDWEAKAPLSDLETRSINLIKAATEKVPLPAKVACFPDSYPVSLLMSSSSAQTMRGRHVHLHQAKLSVPNLSQDLKVHGREHRCRILHVRRRRSSRMHCTRSSPYRHRSSSTIGSR
jgi:hypothetical protein